MISSDYRLSIKNVTYYTDEIEGEGCRGAHHCFLSAKLCQKIKIFGARQQKKNLASIKTACNYYYHLLCMYYLDSVLLRWWRMSLPYIYIDLIYNKSRKQPTYNSVRHHKQQRKPKQNASLLHVFFTVLPYHTNTSMMNTEGMPLLKYAPHPPCGLEHPPAEAVPFPATTATTKKTRGTRAALLVVCVLAAVVVGVTSWSGSRKTCCYQIGYRCFYLWCWDQSPDVRFAVRVVVLLLLLLSSLFRRVLRSITAHQSTD